MAELSPTDWTRRRHCLHEASLEKPLGKTQNNIEIAGENSHSESYKSILKEFEGIKEIRLGSRSLQQHTCFSAVSRCKFLTAPLALQLKCER